MRASLRARLFPNPPRRIPAHRLLSVTLRTAHLMTFGMLLGGHVFEVDPSHLFPFLVATIVTGAGLMALELASSFAWLFMGKGVAVLVKLLLLGMVPFFWEHRVALLLLTVILASVAAHMPSRFRHYSFLTRRSEPPERQLLAPPAPRSSSSATRESTPPGAPRSP